MRYGEKSRQKAQQNVFQKNETAFGREKKKKGHTKRILSIALLIVLTFFEINGLVVEATEETEQALEQAKEAVSQTEDAIEANEEALDTLGETKSSLDEQLDSLSTQLNSITTNLAILQEQISDKETEIEDKETEIADTQELLEETQEALEEAIATQEEQYESMKKRVQFMYEKGNTYYLEILLSSASLGDFLNRQNYIEELSEYDSNLLEEYVQLSEEISEKKKELEEQEAELEEQQSSLEGEQSDLESLEKDASNEASQVEDLVTQTAGSISVAEDQITTAEEAAEILEAQLEEQNETVSELEAQLEEERRLQELSDNSVWRDISEITFEDGDEALLANLIYCEAGGESYAGQLAVGAVVMNRVMSGAFPDTISGVIYQSGQFEPVTSGRFAVALASDSATDSCYQAAEAAMSGESNVSDCLFFRTPIDEVTPEYTIGGHIFY